MAGDALFPPTPLERIAVVVKVLDEEHRYRVRMLEKHGVDQLRYWKKRVAQTDEALAHLAALAEEVAP